MHSLFELWLASWAGVQGPVGARRLHACVLMVLMWVECACVRVAKCAAYALKFTLVVSAHAQAGRS